MAVETYPGAFLFVLDVSEHDAASTKALVKGVSKNTRWSDIGPAVDTVLVTALTDEDATMVRMAVFDQIIDESRMTGVRLV